MWKKIRCAVLFITIGLTGNKNLLAQSIPVVHIDSVTVVDDQSVLIDWQPSSDLRVDGYFIYRMYENNLGTVIFADPVTVNGRATENFLYVDQAGIVDLPSQLSLRFYITAFDQDVNPLEQSNLDSVASKPHNTIYLDYELDTCNASVTLSWNHYATNLNGWTDGISRYELWESQDGGNDVLQYSGNNLSFTRTQLITGVNYRYKIRAVSGDLSKTSTSNVKMVSGTFDKAPAFLYLHNASVATDNNTVTLSWLADSASVPLTYKILVSEDDINYVQIRQLDHIAYQRDNQVSVNGLDCQNTSYYFRIITSSQCPNSIDTTDIARTILLRATRLTENANLLEWNQYENWSVGTNMFELYRIDTDNSGVSTFTLIATLPNNVFNYTDNNPVLSPVDHSIAYCIRAYQNPNDPYGVQSVTQSNVAYLYEELQILAPNVFYPTRSNGIFRPIIHFGNPQKFNMKVYNRWGKMIYETNDEFEGWNGRERNGSSITSPGAYIYIIEVVDFNGKNHRKSGTIALVD